MSNTIGCCHVDLEWGLACMRGWRLGRYNIDGVAVERSREETDGVADLGHRHAK